jgi:hypothetical protein
MESTYLDYNKLKKKLSLLEKVAMIRYNRSALPSSGYSLSILRYFSEICNTLFAIHYFL